MLYVLYYVKIYISLLSNFTFFGIGKYFIKLNHKNIVKLIDYDKEPVPFIVMEYCKNGNLRNLLLKKKLSTNEALRIFKGVVEAIDYAHRMGVIHRDIKPENILFDDDWTPKLSDWGIAKLMQSISTVSGYSGTPRYSAPEQIYPRKYGKVDQRTDVWQLGCLLYEMLTGSPPFRANDMGELIMKIINEEPNFTQINDSKLVELLKKCLTKEKKMRISNTSDILIILTEYEGTIIDKVAVRRKHAIIKVLRPLLNHSSQVVRRIALALITELSEGHINKDLLTFFETALKHNLTNDKKELARAIGRIFKNKGNKEVLTVLIPLIKDSDSDVREAAVRAIGDVFRGSDREMEMLGALNVFLKNSDSDVREAAVRAIGEVFKGSGSKKALTVLVPLIRDQSWEIRKVAANTIGEVFRGSSSREALNVLKPLIKDSSRYVRKAAREAVKKIRSS